MKRNRFTEEQIIGILKEHEAGISVSDLCRKHGVSDASMDLPGKSGGTSDSMIATGGLYDEQAETRIYARV